MNIQSVSSINSKYVFSSQNKINKNNIYQSLERSSLADSVSFQAKKEKEEGTSFSCKEADILRYDLDYSKPSIMRGNYSVSGENLNLEIKNKLGGGRDIVGNIYDSEVNLNLNSGVFGVYGGKVTGMINDKPIDLKYISREGIKKIEIYGDITNIDSDTMSVLLLLIKDKIKFDIKSEEAMMLIAMAST